MANFGDIASSLSIPAGMAVRRNAANTDYETFTPQVSDATLTAFAGLTITQGSLIYGTGADAFAVLAKDTNATRYLSNQGTSNNPSWNQVNLANGVTGTLPIASGGTSQGSQTTNGVAYFNGTGIVTGSVVTFNGSTLAVSSSANVAFDSPFVQVRGTSLLVGGNGLGTYLQFAGGSTGSNTYGDFTFGVGGGSREFRLINQLSSRYVMFVTGGSDVQNANNSEVGFGTTSPSAKVHVVQSNLNHPTMIIQGIASQSQNLLTLQNSGGTVGFFDISGNLHLENGVNLVFGTSTGTKIGTSSSQKIGFFNATPVTQRSNIGAITDTTGGSTGNSLADVDAGGGIVGVTETNDNFATLCQRMNRVEQVLQELGLTA